MIGWLFAGQGSERPGMGLDLASGSAAASALIERAGRAAGVDALRLLDRGGEGWGKTECMQPLIVAVSLAFARELRARGQRPDFVLGHSLGELSAWCAAECVSPEDAISVAAERGRVMAREAALHPGGMLALVGCDLDTALQAVELGRSAGSLELAAHNAADEWVVTGELPALAALAARYRVQRLPVSGAWHGRAMAGAVEELRAALCGVSRSPASARFVSNQTGLVVEDEAAIPDLLAGQLRHPVQWVRCLETLAERTVADIVTLGPSAALRALVRKNLGSAVRVHGVETARDVDRVATQLATR